MSVESFNPENGASNHETGAAALSASGPSSTSLALSEPAAKHFADRLARSGKAAIRLSLKESGCTGFKYEIDEIEESAISETDVPIENVHGARVYLDSRYLDAFKGTIVDYETQGLNKQLVLKNPNVADSCGCGESFNFQ